MSPRSDMRTDTDTRFLILTASNVNLAALINAPIYILAGFVILLIHFTVMILMAKVFKLDLYTCGIASIANVGGVASAPIIAATYDKNLVSVSISKTRPFSII